MLDEDPAIMQRRTALAKRLELYKSAQAEIDAVAWSKQTDFELCINGVLLMKFEKRLGW